jgi:hypothetical protein
MANPIPPNPSIVETTIVNATPRTLSWSAVIGGAVAALGIHLLLTLFFAGLGLQAVAPMQDPNPGVEFTVATGIAWSVSSLIALWCGGWIAGRSLQSPDRKLGSIHGFVVWSLATVTLFLVFSATAGMAAAGAARLAGKGLAAVGGAMGSTASAAANSDQGRWIVNSFIEEAMPPKAEGGNEGAAATAPNRARARREVQMAVTRVFAQGQDIHSPENQNLVTQALVDSTGRSEADAKQLVKEWTDSYDLLQKNLQAAGENGARSAREVAEKGRKAATRAAIWTFAAFVLGALAGTTGGRAGVGGFRRAVNEGKIDVPA